MQNAECWRLLRAASSGVQMSHTFELKPVAGAGTLTGMWDDCQPWALGGGGCLGLGCASAVLVTGMVLLVRSRRRRRTRNL